MKQAQLEELLRKKGIGPEGSKTLNDEELSQLNHLLKAPETSLTTRATLLTALLTLPASEAEKSWLANGYASPEQILPVELLPYFSKSTPHPFWKLIHQLTENKDLSQTEASQGIAYVFDPSVPEFLKASFLEGARLKRETFEENACFFSYLYNKSQRRQTDLPLIIDIADNYDGSNRTRNFSLFTSCLLASAGFPTLVHGLDKVAPKEGHTACQILQAAGKNAFISLDHAHEQLLNKRIGWAYIDQSVSFPELFALKQMRKEMVKRPFLATFEKLLQPIRAQNGNAIVTGFTHAHYRTEVINQLTGQGSCSQALVMKGMEGSSHLSMSKPTVAVLYDGIQISDEPVHPFDFGLAEVEEAQDKNVNALNSLEEGLAALKGEKNMAREKIVYLALVILSKFNLNSSVTKDTLYQLLDTGNPLQRWYQGNEIA